MDIGELLGTLFQIQDDYLERVSSKDFLQKFKEGFLGEFPGQLDLGITRFFSKPKSIYDQYYNDPWLYEGEKYGMKEVSRDEVVQLYQKAIETNSKYTFLKHLIFFNSSRLFTVYKRLISNYFYLEYFQINVRPQHS